MPLPRLLCASNAVLCGAKQHLFCIASPFTVSRSAPNQTLPEIDWQRIRKTERIAKNTRNPLALRRQLECMPHLRTQPQCTEVSMYPRVHVCCHKHILKTVLCRAKHPSAVLFVSVHMPFLSLRSISDRKAAGYLM